ncbi:MAG: 2-oxoacid:ferredoxin oxidoreductase subunit gamma, partial [Nitrospira sp.]|nr:2-oxoacid:ferredoxin oxidoreductase subunit gamma [Nitrospira sp.]
MEKRVIIAGSGGQGILFFGRILAHAAMLENREVTWFPSYGAEVRGGTANCTIIISDELIGSPIVTCPDILIV